MNTYQRTLFYSWQSDLPTVENRNLIYKATQKALKEIYRKRKITIKLDQATRKTPGSPDITENIFQKINESNIFLADISIINPNSQTKKTPNPNVLLELGYAARVLGWQKIITILNTKYGDPNRLPFDLRNRRTLTYNSIEMSQRNQSLLLNQLAKDIEAALLNIIDNIGLDDNIFLFLKRRIDTEILKLVSQFLKIFKEGPKPGSYLVNVRWFLELNEKEISKVLQNLSILGFYLFKDYERNKIAFQKLIQEALCSPYYPKEILNALINIYDWFALYERFWREYSSKLFKKTKRKDKKLTILEIKRHPFNSNLVDLLLLIKLDNAHGIVLDAGTFPTSYVHSPNTLLQFYKINLNLMDKYANIIFLFISNVRDWLNLTDYEIILDLVKQFKMIRKERHITILSNYGN